MNAYIFENAAEAETAERFATLDTLYNFRTFRFLERPASGRVGTAWRSAEGSAYRKPAHLELRRHDIGT